MSCHTSGARVQTSRLAAGGSLGGVAAFFFDARAVRLSSRLCARYKGVSPPAESSAMEQIESDYVIVGAGSAGCVIANRLSADPGTRVHLVEAGPASHPLTRLPISFGLLINHSRVNWCYESEPEAATAGRHIPVPRGKVLGGSSAINGLVYVRGQRLDYDTWRQLGNAGWGYDDVLPLFKRAEHFEPGGGESRGRGGPVNVSVTPDESPLYDALFAAAGEIGIPRNPDYNAEVQEGIGKTQTTIRNGRRVSAATAYLTPAAKRPNLQITTGALARRLLIEKGRCRGVEISTRAGALRLRASREVVLSAGSIGSPQLLELSGIGRPEVLETSGIELVHRLDGVGENLHDHYAPRLVYRLSDARASYNTRARGLGLVWQVVRYALTRRGFLSLPSAPLLAFLKTREGLAAPDVQLHLVSYAIEDVARRILMREPGMTVTVYQLRPESTGSVHVRSADPAAAPRIRFNFLSAGVDRQVLLAGVRKARALLGAPAMRALFDAEVRPGPAIESDEALLEWIEGNAQTTYHPVGTCKMGNDPLAVVDPALRVHGIEGLRVADGSIMPTLVSGNTNAACMMIGEKAADLMSRGR